MRSFIVFLAVVLIIGLVWLVLPILEQRGRDHENRLVAALQLVEDAIVASSVDILRVDLFSPEISQLPGDGRWRLTGIVSTQDRAGKPVHVYYDAAVTFTCLPYADPECGRIETLAIEDQAVVIDGAIVAELQSVLAATAETLIQVVPSESSASPATGSGETAALPGPQMEAPVAPATAPAAPAIPAPAAPDTGTAAASDDSALDATTTEPIDPEAEPYEGDRLIFLVQKRLKELGFDTGPVDGKTGPRTTSAIQVYQRRAGLEVDGAATDALLEHLNQNAPAAAQ